MLPKHDRVSRGSDIRRIFNSKQFYFSSTLLRLIAASNSLAHSRWVIVCPGSLGGAVVRNRLRRVVSAVLQDIRHNINKNLDIVVVLRRRGGRARDYKQTIEKGLVEF